MKSQRISVDTLDKAGEAPTHLAAMTFAVAWDSDDARRIDCATRAFSELVQHGADPFVRSLKGLTPRDTAGDNGARLAGNASLDMVVAGGA